jgi:hypothetical protein
MTPQQQALLDLLPTDELQRALLNRFDAAVFHGMKSRPVEGQKDAHIKAWGVRGDLYKVIGLGHTIIARTQRMIENAEEEASADEL